MRVLPCLGGDANNDWLEAFKGLVTCPKRALILRLVRPGLSSSKAFRQSQSPHSAGNRGGHHASCGHQLQHSATSSGTTIKSKPKWLQSCKKFAVNAAALWCLIKRRWASIVQKGQNDSLWACSLSPHEFTVYSPVKLWVG